MGRREPDDPGPVDCACGWPLIPCRAVDGLVPERYDYSGTRAVPKAGDACPKEPPTLSGVTKRLLVHRWRRLGDDEWHPKMGRARFVCDECGSTWPTGSAVFPCPGKRKAK